MSRNDSSSRAFFMPIGTGVPVPTPSQRMLTPKSMPRKHSVSASMQSARGLLSQQPVTTPTRTRRRFATHSASTPAISIETRSLSPNVSIRPPSRFYESIRFTHGRLCDAGRFARLGGKYLPCRLEYFRGRGFFHSPKMMRIKSAPVACAMHASMTAKRGASFNDSSRRTVRALTLQSADVSEVRMPAAFIAVRKRSPNVDVLSTEKIFRLFSLTTPRNKNAPS